MRNEFFETIRDSMDEGLKNMKEKIPNKETIETIEKAEKGEDVESFNTVEELFEDLDNG